MFPTYTRRKRFLWADRICRTIEAMTVAALSLVCLLVFLTGCGELEPPANPPRPVSTVTLQTHSPGASTRLAGTVETWKRVEVSFEVPGRIVQMLDAGTEIRGERINTSGDRIEAGTVIAKLDDERYRIALNEQHALLSAARAKLRANETELELVIPQRLNAAQANLELQGQEIERFTRMVAENSAPQEQLDQIQAAYRVAQARVAEVESLLVAKAAEVEAVQAQVLMAEELVVLARVDLADCTLYAPFGGQIARVHLIVGAYAFRGQPVATVQMMDPINVQVALSPRLDAQVNYNDRVQVYLPDSDEVLEGFVYLKDSFADPATRTYLATLLVRNRRVTAGLDVEIDGSTPRATELLPLERERADGEGSIYTEVGTLYEDESGYYVWKAVGLHWRDLWEEYDPRVKVKKARVTLGEGMLNFVQLYTYRELTDQGELVANQDLVLRGVTGEVSDGDTVLLVRERWLLRPGDVVTAGMRGTRLEPGFYVPELAIHYDGQRHQVFTVQPSGDGRHTAFQVEVRLKETIGGLRRIEAVQDTQLAVGMQVIVDGAQYVSDGEVINPVEELAHTR